MFSNYNSNKIPILYINVPVFIYMICLLAESTTTEEPGPSEASPMDSGSTTCGPFTGLWSRSAQLSPRKQYLCAYASRLRVRMSRLKKKCAKTNSVQEQTSDQKLNKLIADLSQFLESPVLDFVVSQIRAAKWHHKINLLHCQFIIAVHGLTGCSGKYFSCHLSVH